MNQFRFLQLIAELECAGAARVIGPNRCNVTGHAIVQHASGSFESALKGDLLLILDFDSSVRPVEAQTLCVEAAQEYASLVSK